MQKMVDEHDTATLARYTELLHDRLRQRPGRRSQPDTVTIAGEDMTAVEFEGVQIVGTDGSEVAVGEDASAVVAEGGTNEANEAGETNETTDPASIGDDVDMEHLQNEVTNLSPEEVMSMMESSPESARVLCCCLCRRERGRKRGPLPQGLNWLCASCKSRRR